MRSAFGVEHGFSKAIIGGGVPKVVKKPSLPKGMKRLRLTREDAGDLTSIVARRRKKDLGVLVLHNKPGSATHGQIANVTVQPQHQRKGIATAMYQHAQRKGIQPVHHPIRNKEGDAWAHAVGGKIPKRKYPRALDNPPPPE